MDWQNAIKWENIETSKVLYLDKTGFYALFAGKSDASNNKWVENKLLYIGQSSEQTLRKRIRQPHQAYDLRQQVAD